MAALPRRCGKLLEFRLSTTQKLYSRHNYPTCRDCIYVHYTPRHFDFRLWKDDTIDFCQHLKMLPTEYGCHRRAALGDDAVQCH